MVSADGVTPSRMVSVSASVNLPLHHKVQKISSGTGSPGWSRKKGRKTVAGRTSGIRKPHKLHSTNVRHSLRKQTEQKDPSENQLIMVHLEKPP